VSYDWLQISEVTLYRACISWAETQLQKLLVESPTEHAIREQLGEVFYKIRFPSTSLEEFAQNVGKSDILTCAEKASIYYYIGTRDHGNYSLSFDWKNRYNEQMIDRFNTVIIGNWGCNYQPNAIQFKADKDIILTAIGTYPKGNQYNNGYNVLNPFQLAIDINENSHPHHQSQHITLKRHHPGSPQSSRRIGGVTAINVNSTMFDDTNIAKVPLDESLELKSGVHYTISIRQVNGDGCYSRYGQTSTPDDPVKTEGATFWFYNSGSTSTTTQSGQIPRLYYIVM